MTDSDENQLEQPNSSEEARVPPAQSPEVSEIEILNSKISELGAGLEQYKDQLLRKAAEFENYKRRTENDYAANVRFSNEELIVKLLPVLDDLERFVKALRKGSEEAAAAREESPFNKGLELILSKFKNILDRQGVKPFDALGKPFDPLMHDALMQIPRDDVPSHTVVEEVEKGYMLHDKVIRHAKVVVSADTQTAEESASASETRDSN